MRKENRKLMQLKETLSDGREMAVSDLCALLNVNRSRVYEYIEMLKKDNISIVTSVKSRKVYYHIENNMESDLHYEPIETRDVIKSLIVKSLCDGVKSAKEIREELKIFDIEVSQGTLYNCVNDAIRKKEIFRYGKDDSKLGENKYLIPNGNEIPLIVRVNDSEQYTLFSKTPDAHIQSRSLENLKKKIAILSSETEIDEFDDSLFLQYGRKSRMNEEMQDFYDELVRNDFINHGIEFDYRNEKRILFVGMVVYSQMQDMLYLIGHKGHEYQVLRCSDISNIRCLSNLNNEEYGKSIYEDIYHKMFCISVSEKANSVVVKFIDTKFARVQLEGLCRYRKNAKVTNQSDCLIYEDKISDLDNFMVFLRGFGAEAEVIEPRKLATKLAENKNRIMQRYTEKGD